MDLSKMIEIIPQLFMYFIPGYISLNIRKRYRQESNYKEKDLIILSIVYSYLIDRIIFIIEYILSSRISLSLEWRTIVALIISIMVGYIITIYPDSKISKKVGIMLKSNTEPYSTVWNYAMKNSKGAWARVFLRDEDIYYIGTLSKYTCDPDHEVKEVYLTNFSSYSITSNEENEDRSDDEKACVLINVTDVKRIEIFEE